MSGEYQGQLAYRALERQIVTLELAPGALVTERQLIERAGQGRTPVREAVQKLAWQGLVVIRPRVGVEVAAITPGAYQDIMAVRARLEPLAASLAARSATTAEQERLRNCAEAMSGAAAAGAMIAFLEADKTFDDILEGSCGNPFLANALGPLKTQARRIWFANAGPADMDLSVALHLSVIRAIGNRAAEAAEQAMTALIDTLAEASARRGVH